jgi:hypothetical protein
MAGCPHDTCIPCTAGLLKIGCQHLQLSYKCPVCRHDYGLTDVAVKEIFLHGVPSHSKTVDACCGKVFAVSHLPCAREGCYDCDYSTIVKVELPRP